MLPEEQEFLEKLYRKMFPSLHQYATSLLSKSGFDANLAEELVQDTLMWMWENRTTLIPEMSLKSLLFTIVKNKSLNHLSHDTVRSRVMRQLEERYRDEFDDPDLYLENELMQRFTAALEKLPPEFQETFRMHRLEGMTHRQIAEQLGVSPQTVNYRIGQTVRFLRMELREYWPLIVLLLGIEIR